MPYKIIVSKEVYKDIDDIIHYIAVELVNPKAAKTFLDDVEISYEALVNNPYIYSLCNDARLCKESYRKIAIKNYLIIYRIINEEKSVIVLRIIYGGRNYTELI
ncbi:plasmid stabilization system protein ParE [Natranaerovirga pectinivora]|uniref:Plasmid stabilization system protein ParE n=1 Tax=Natranaerovirga pectinivora TaxID=682400 RepID=A0A4V2V0G0_9FIRM|nr:type II toxin-antitoxin system RelE/ParE family toxin [Natranaerovirga pectinivora]TCT15997.1 plasmid stabilization system protein ParE [Natranaerovirga pectinivora]